MGVQRIHHNSLKTQKIKNKNYKIQYLNVVYLEGVRLADI